ncbi:MAG: NAD(P)H-quinone oxidoreductase [Rhizobiaceae bacterium]|nr:NAD(P)H-quinone oxidoreductase [Rhizobiaceae bacterium]
MRDDFPTDFPNHMPDMLPATMRAVEISRPGGPEVLIPVSRPLPRPGPGEVLIEVAAAGVNRPDCLQRAGAYPPPPGASDLPGLEVSGVVAALGAGVTSFAIGDRVCALTPGGAYAQFVAAPALQVLPAPASLSAIEAAAVPETFFTVWGNVFMRGRLQAGETLLVHGGASGIGTTAIQLAKAFGAAVIVTAGSDERCAACLALGADHAVNHRTTDFVDAVKTITAGRGADVILDMVAGDYVNRNYKAAAVEGRIVQIATLNGAEVQVDVRLLMGKRLTHTGSTLRPQSIAAKGEIARQLKAHVWPLIEAGTITPLIDTVFPLEDAAKAHARMEAGEVTGKLVLRVAG